MMMSIGVQILFLDQLGSIWHQIRSTEWLRRLITPVTGRPDTETWKSWFHLPACCQHPPYLAKPRYPAKTYGRKPSLPQYPAAGYRGLSVLYLPVCRSPRRASPWGRESVSRSMGVPRAQRSCRRWKDYGMSRKRSNLKINFNVRPSVFAVFSTFSLKNRWKPFLLKLAKKVFIWSRNQIVFFLIPLNFK